MSNLSKILEELTLKNTVFLYEEFSDLVCKMIPEETGVRTFIKRKGKEEYEVTSNSEIVMNIEQGGEFITQNEYDEF